MGCLGVYVRPVGITLNGAGDVESRQKETLGCLIFFNKSLKEKQTETLEVSAIQFLFGKTPSTHQNKELKFLESQLHKAVFP